jgi:hypothetical protein
MAKTAKPKMTMPVKAPAAKLTPSAAARIRVKANAAMKGAK